MAGLIALALVGLALCVLFDMAEGVLISAKRQPVRERAEKGELAAQRAQRVLADLPGLFGVTMAGATVAIVVLASATIHLVNRWLPELRVTWAALAAVGAVTAAVLLISHALARGVGRWMADRAILITAWTLGWLRTALHPIEIWVEAVGRIASRLLWRQRLTGESGAASVAALSTQHPVSKAHMLEMLHQSEREGVIETSERLMIHRILNLHTTRVQEIMRPLIRVVALQESELTEDRLRAVARATGFSRFPVYRRFIIDLIGHIDIYQALAAPERSPGDLRALVQPPHYVPETKRVDDLLQEFLHDRRRVAIVIDEHGSCSGWVTREDILEEIFGEIADEFDRERPRWRSLTGGAIEFEAGVDIDDVNSHFGLAIPTLHCDTLAGFIYERLGRVPQVGECVRHGGRTLRVIEMNGQQIVRVRLEPSDSHAQ
ncbi:HlyC/CorC family transporter [Candidatus Sumerlaeota bacterium]|nr:HlyC/CorC family transporter [Candidatus Sumerlaeota bacterium]